MKKYYLVAFILCGALWTSAQQQNQQTIRKYWSEGDLSCEDFRGNPIPNSAYSAYLEYSMEYSLDTREINGVTFEGYRTKVYMYRNISWIKEGHCTEFTLKYCQTMFNIAEFHARKLQWDLNKLTDSDFSSDFSPSSYHAIHADNRNIELARFTSESDYGRRDSVIQYWYELSKNRLEAYPKDTIPVMEKRNFAFRYGYGLGYTAFNGPATEYLKNHIRAADFHFSMTINSFVYEFDMILDAGRSRKEFNNKYYSLDKDTGNTVGFFELGFGYQLFEGKRISAYPFLKAGAMQFTRQDRYENDYIEGPWRFQPGIGISFTYKFDEYHRTLINSSSPYLQARICWKPFFYTGPLKGDMISFSLIFGLFGQGLKVSSWN